MCNAINLKSVNQSDELGNILLAYTYKKTYLCCTENKSKLYRLIAPLMGLSSALIQVAIRISLIVENFLKALGNIFGALIFKDVYLRDGLKNLIATSINLVKLPFTVVARIAILIRESLYLFGGNLEKYSKNNWFKYDPKADIAMCDAKAQLKNKRIEEENKHAFQRAKEAAEAQNATPKQMYEFALIYDNGRITTRDVEQYEVWLQRAADKGHNLATFALAQLKEHNRDYESVVSVLQSADHLGNEKAKAALLIYQLEEAEGGLEDSEAYGRYVQLAQMGNFAACWIAGYLCLTGKGGVNKNSAEAKKHFTRLVNHRLSFMEASLCVRKPEIQQKREELISYARCALVWLDQQNRDEDMPTSRRGNEDLYTEMMIFLNVETEENEQKKQMQQYVREKYSTNTANNIMHSLDIENVKLFSPHISRMLVR
ncbi:MAG: tetratricopeptide repeat protein [Chlamydiales bacterium]